MQQLTTKAGLLETVRTERANLEHIVAEVGESRLTEPIFARGWTLKDIVAHLNGWRERSLARLEAARDGREPASPWPAELGEDVDAINDWLYERDRDRPAADVLRDNRANFERLEAALAAIPESDLFEPGRYRWMGGNAIGPAVIGGVAAHFHDEHEPDIRAWLESGEA